MIIQHRVLIMTLLQGEYIFKPITKGYSRDVHKAVTESLWFLDVAIKSETFVGESEHARIHSFYSLKQTTLSAVGAREKAYCCE